MPTNMPSLVSAITQDFSRFYANTPSVFEKQVSVIVHKPSVCFLRGAKHFCQAKRKHKVAIPGHVMNYTVIVLNFSNTASTFEVKIEDIMKKKVVTFALGGMMFSLTGCYTHICPTYSVKPEQKPTQEVMQKQLNDRMEKAS